MFWYKYKVDSWQRSALLTFSHSKIISRFPKTLEVQSLNLHMTRSDIAFLSKIGSDTTGARGRVNLPFSPSKKTWKQRRTTFRSTVEGCALCEKPAEMSKETPWISFRTNLFNGVSLTSERIYPDFLALFQRFLNITLLDALYAQITERYGHFFVIYLECAHATFASLFSNQIMWVRSIWCIFCHTRHHDNCTSLVPLHFNRGICLVFRWTINTWNRSGRPSLTFVPKTECLRCWLLCNYRFTWIIHISHVWLSWHYVANGCCCRTRNSLL